MRVRVHTHALAEFFEFQSVVPHRGLATIPDLQDGVYEVRVYVYTRVVCMHVCMHSSMFAHVHGMGCFERIPLHGFILFNTLLLLLFYMHTQIHIVICFLWFTTGEVCLT